MGSHFVGAVVAEPGLLVAAKVAVCRPTTTVLLAMIAGAPAPDPISATGVPLERALTVRVTPVPPGIGATIATSPCASMTITPLPVTGIEGTYGSTSSIRLQVEL